MTHEPQDDSDGFLSAPSARTERLVLAGTLLVGAFILLWNLSASGLWEPWEMDRADLARTMTEPAAAVAALSEETGPTREAIDAAAGESELVVRYVDPPSAGARGVAAGARSVQEALDTARREIVAAVIIDAALLVPEPGPDADWTRAASRLREAAAYVPTGRVLLIDGREGADLAQTTRNLADAWTGSAVDRVVTQWRLGKYLPDDMEAGAPGEQAAEPDASGAAQLLDDRISVVAASDQTKIGEVLADASGSGGAIARFKRDGETFTIPPLSIWTMALSFEVFGASEFSARLPGVIFALLTLLVFLYLTRSVWSVRVALFAGIVLVTTPIFFAEARSAAGKTGLILGLTLFVAGLLREEAGARRSEVWGFVVSGIVVGFLAKGLYALALFAIIAGAAAFIAGERRPKRWLVPLATGATLGLAALWVLTSPDSSFAGQFRFTNDIFSKGPDAYHRNFDYVIHHVGFGGFPWSPFYWVAIGAAVLSASARKDRKLLLVALWFAVPTVMMMAMLKSYNQFIWPAATAGAIGVGLLFDQVLRRGFRNPLIAFLVLIMLFMLSHDLGHSAKPLAGFLTFDPPFAKSGSLRFPESLTLPSALRYLVLLAGLFLLLYSARLWTFTGKAVRFFRRDLPFSITLGVLALLSGVLWIAFVANKYAVGMRLPAARELSEAQRTFASGFVLSADPLVLVAWLAIALAIGLVFWRIVRREKVRVPPHPPGPLGSIRATIPGAVWMALAFSMLYSVPTPDGYWSEIFGDSAIVPVFAAVAASAVLMFLAARSLPATILTALGTFGLFVAAQLSRDADLITWYSVLLTVAGFLAFAWALVPRIWAYADRVALWSCVAAAAGLFLLALPLIDRWNVVSPILYPGASENLAAYLGVLTVPFIVLIIALLAFRWVSRPVDWLVALAARVMERGRAVVAFALAAGLVFTVGTVAGFYRDLARNVSQKHIVETYRKAEGLGGADLGEHIFKHGSFASAGRKDANFYTAAIPEVRDRKSAMTLLLARQDTAAKLDTAEGTGTYLAPGWDAKNDPDGDGKRNWTAIRGILTGAGEASATDTKASWKPDEHKGRVLVDARGTTWTIAGNDATSLRLEGSGRPAWVPGNPTRSFYAIDDPAAPVHTATAPSRQREYFLLPMDSFTQINHEFRELSGGAHIPVIDARSYRVMLAASWLDEGEKQQNRYANATLTRAEFDALDTPGLFRSWANFDDRLRFVGSVLDKEVVSRGESVTLSTYWEVTKKIRGSYKFFVHVDRPGTSNRIHGDHWPLNLTKGGEDDKGCTGCYRTDQWMVGDIVKDTYELEVPIGTPSGPQDIWMGLYKPGGGARMKIKDWDKTLGRHDGNDRARVGTFQVR